MTPLLVLLPGLDGTRFLFEPILQEWGSEAITVSYPKALPSDYKTLLTVVLEALPKERNFVLLGWSFSGPLALMAAATKPAGLLGVVLCASFVQKPIPWVPAVARRLAWPWLFGMSGSLSIAKTALAGHSSKEIKDLIKAAHDAVPNQVMAARVRQVLTADVRDELVCCSVPVCYLRAKGDRVVPARNLKRIQGLRPDVHAVTVPGPHIALATHPAEAAAAIRSFAQGLVSR